MSSSSGNSKRTRSERVATLKLPPGLIARGFETVRRSDVLLRVGLCLLTALAVWGITGGWVPPFSYRAGDIPWDTGRPDRNLVEVVGALPLAPCPALEVGCGYGHNARWLADQGFGVTGIDLSPHAIEGARQASEGYPIVFMVADFLSDAISGKPFGFVFDRGCFHLAETVSDRQQFASQVSAHLSPRGYWLTLVGSSDDAPRDSGPPRRSAQQIIVAVEPYFELRLLRAGYFDSNRAQAPKAWIVLLRRRDVVKKD